MSGFELGGFRDRYDALSPRDRRALRLGALILLPALFWAGAVRPYTQALADLNDRLASERALLARELAVLEEAELYPRRLAVAGNAVDRWTARFIRTPNVALAEAEVTAVFERLALESRVLLEEVRAIPIPPGAAAPPEGLQTLRMSVSGESDFEGVLTLLRGLENDPLLFRIIGVSVDRAGGGGVGGGGGYDAGSGPSALSFVVVIESFAPADRAELSKKTARAARADG